MKVFYIFKNLFKIVFWFALAILLTNYIGLWYGIVVFAGLCFVWNIALTLMWEHTVSNRTLLQIIFSTSVSLPFTAYGCYCSPRYGTDGRTNGLPPIDELDSACKIHDETMINTDKLHIEGIITKEERIRRKNSGDWKFMKSAITSSNTASGMYLILLEVGFLFRIIGRVFTKR